MLPELIWWLGVAAVLCLGIFVQAAAGFAAGMIIVPSLLWLGYMIPEASMALLIATVPQNVFGVYSLRESIDRNKVIWPGIGRVAFFPLGIIVLIAIEESYSLDRLRQIVGAAVLLATTMTICFRPHPRPHLKPIWAWIAFPVSGFLQGLVGMGGPAMVFWVAAHDWSAREMRGFLFCMYLVSLPPAIGMLFAFFGYRVVAPALAAAASLPLLLLATWLGLKLGNWLGRQRLRRVTLGLLILIGLVGLASPWVRG